jgi:hypothetical protein
VLLSVTIAGDGAYWGNSKLSSEAFEFGLGIVFSTVVYDGLHWILQSLLHWVMGVESGMLLYGRFHPIGLIYGRLTGIYRNVLNGTVSIFSWCTPFTSPSPVNTMLSPDSKLQASTSSYETN